MEKEKYIEKWIEGTLSDEERQAFEQTEDYQSLKKLLESVNAFRAPEYDVEAELSKLKTSIPAKEGKVVRMNWWKPLLQTAAVFIVIAGIYFLFMQESMTTFKTEASQKTEVLLPDSSVVILNALSSVSYQTQNWNKNRTVQLEGEAFFKVAKGSKFDVQTSSGVVSVLGTQFNVKDRDNYFEVSCYEGLVQVKTEQGTDKLKKSQSIRLLSGELSKTESQSETAPSWMLSISSFKSIPFYHVVREFERQYGTQVTFVDVDTTQLFTGSFTHDDADLAIQSIAYPLNLNYKHSDENTITLSGDTE